MYSEIFDVVDSFINSGQTPSLDEQSDEGSKSGAENHTWQEETGWHVGSVSDASQEVPDSEEDHNFTDRDGDILADQGVDLNNSKR